MAKLYEGEQEGPVKKKYLRYSISREPYLAMARKCAKLTIPALMPKGTARPVRLTTPYQTTGAQGVNNLSAKLVMTLFPPNASFFRLSIGQFDLEQQIKNAVAVIAEQSQLDEERTAALYAEQSKVVNQDLEKRLAAVETAVMREFELLNNRSTDTEALKHLIVCGNVLRYCPPDRKTKPRIYKLDSYVVKRQPDGEVLEIIAKEAVSPLTLDPEVRSACGLEVDMENLEKVYDLYTHIWRSEDVMGPCWEVRQELNGHYIPETEGKYDIDECPWLPLRWTKVDGEDYGRGHVEEYYGALASLEGLSKSLLQSAAGAARLLLMVNTTTGTGTKIKDVARAENGAVVPGNAADVSFLKSDKYHDLRTPAEQIDSLERKLGHAFLMTSSVQRDAERVTAHELRLMVNELETALGGTYTTLGPEYQQPMVINIMRRMQKRGSLPELPDDVEPMILTGMEALGRNAELQRLYEFISAAQSIGSEEVNMRINAAGVLSRLAASIGLNTEGLLKSEEEVAQIKEQQAKAAQEAAMIKSLGPQAIKAGTQMISQNQQE